VLKALKAVAKKQLVLHVVKDDEGVAAQPDPQYPNFVHYTTREAAEEGYVLYEDAGRDSIPPV